MTERRRTVRVTDNAFDEIDAVLGDSRSASGRPSSGDFLAVEMPRIIERFAEGFDGLMPAVPELPTIRVLVSTGTLVRRYAVVGILVADDSIALIGIDIEL